MSGRALLELFHHPLEHLPRRLVARMMQNVFTVAAGRRRAMDPIARSSAMAPAGIARSPEQGWFVRATKAILGEGGE